jgi:hypothetical protein
MRLSVQPLNSYIKLYADFEEHIFLITDKIWIFIYWTV